MMTRGTPWPIAYGVFTIGMGIVGWITFLLLRFFENRKLRSTPAVSNNTRL
jgi:magnesium transporter